MSAKKKQKIADNRKIREELFSDSCIRTVQKLWQGPVASEVPKYTPIRIAEYDVDIIQTPFPVCLIRNLVPRQIIKEVMEEIPEIHFYEKCNDLYQFHQTTDVANFEHLKAIFKLYSVINTDVLDWVSSALVPTGLRKGIAATLSCYAMGDRLLCHDDKCEDRHIAFVLYLTEDWTAVDGGNLELMDTEKDGSPSRPVVSIPALFNTLVLFEVSHTSYHQVTEVFSDTKKRLSLNGWFHKQNLPEWSEGSPITIEVFSPIASEFTLEEYIFVKYLSFKNQLDIKTMFVSNSEIQLDEFLQPDVLQKVKEEFGSLSISWKMAGPANVRHYELAETYSLPPGLSSLAHLLQSKTWLRFLRNITGLDFLPLAKSDLAAWQRGTPPACRVEMQRWLSGSYTLVHDRDAEFHNSALDVIIRVPMVENGPESDEDGPEAGHVIYIDKQSQDEECLLHLGYKMNSLGLIYREPGTLRFTKYLDATATPFYQIQCLYIPWSPPEDEPDLKHAESESDTDIPGEVEDDDMSAVVFDGEEGEDGEEQEGIVSYDEVEVEVEQLKEEGSPNEESGEDIEDDS